MNIIFEVVDKTGRKIRLTKKQWSHITKKHPEVESLEEIKETIKNPDKITCPKIDQTIGFYYKYFKHKPSPYKYLLILVKYLNGESYVITSYLEDKIK